MVNKKPIDLENAYGVHSKERLQTNPKDSMAKQYADFHKITYENCDSDKPEIIPTKKISYL